ncbi:MAG: aldose epimerase family protein [Empedobacter falsenii]
MTNSKANLVDAEAFRFTHENQSIDLYTISNSNGMTVQFTNLGARIVSLIVPDSDNNLTDVVVGMQTAEEYLSKDEPYYGTIIGPFTGRISNAQFKIKDKTYQLIKNNGENTLHGGHKGLHFAIWSTSLEENKIIFRYQYPHLEEGFPGPIHFEVHYTLTEKNELILEYFGDSENDTIINLTNHSYFNLNGAGNETILEHNLQINSSQITMLNVDYSLSGDFLKVENSPFDFRNFKKIRESINDNHEQLIFGNGYDHFYVLKQTFDETLNHAVTLKGNLSGIELNVYTTAQGVLLYTGNFMSDKVTLKNGSTDGFRTALCLETQNFSDSINQPNFPQKIYNSEEKYYSKTVFEFR